MRPGDAYQAVWGRYAFLRAYDAGHVVLADRDRTNAFVIVAHTRIGPGRDYEPVGSDKADPVRPTLETGTHGTAQGGTARPPGMVGQSGAADPLASVGADCPSVSGDEYEPAGRPGDARLPPQGLTLGAVRPGGQIQSIPGIELLSWLPCMTQYDGAPHCYFIVSNRWPRFHCNACRPAYAAREAILDTVAPLMQSVAFDVLRQQVGLPAATAPAEPEPPAPAAPTEPITASPSVESPSIDNPAPADGGATFCLPPLAPYVRDQPPWHPGPPLWETVSAKAADAMREYFGERAAIAEYDGHAPRPVAEYLAYHQLVVRWEEKNRAA